MERDDVALLERPADADRHCLLPDRDVEEAGEVTGTEALLDLLLEAADEEHLAEEVDEPLARERVSSLLDLGHERSRYQRP